jgi:hypothetical protein
MEPGLFEELCCEDLVPSQHSVPPRIDHVCATQFRDELDEVRSQQEKSACRRCGMVRDDGRCAMISFHPISGVKAMAARSSYMKLRLNSAAL